MLWRFPDKPMVATVNFLSKVSEKYLVQGKIDGWRLQIVKEKESPQFFSRTKGILQLSPALVNIVTEKLQGFQNIWIDAELTGHTHATLGTEWIFLLDLLYYKGEWLGGYPLEERIKILKGLELADFKNILYPSETTRDYLKFFRVLQREIFCEGVVMKRHYSTLIGDLRRSVKNPQWFKVKWR